jgi:hypothetical protein
MSIAHQDFLEYRVGEDYCVTGKMPVSQNCMNDLNLGKRIKLKAVLKNSLISASSFFLFFPQLTLAQSISTSFSCGEPLQSELLTDNQIAKDKNIVDDQTISEQGLTVPSLWFAKEQFDPFGGKMIDNWLAYQDKQQIDLIVNSQLWTLLDYVQRYRFLNQFGTVAREYQYNLRVFNLQKECLAIYTCDFKTLPTQCKIYLERTGEDGLQLDAAVEITPGNSDL